MANIDILLNDIKNAVYGEEVRSAIHDSIKAMNDELMSSSMDCTSNYYNNLPAEVATNGTTYFLTDTKRIMRSGVEYGAADDEVVNSASGEIVKINASSSAVRDLTIDVTPKQSFNGYTEPWKPAGSYNIFKSSCESYTSNDDFTVLTYDNFTVKVYCTGKIVLNGTPTHSGLKVLLGKLASVDPSWDIYLSGVVANRGYRIHAVSADNTKSWGYDIGNGVGIIFPTSSVATDFAQARFLLEFSSNPPTFDNETFYIYVRKSDNDPEVPYCNICPVTPPTYVDIYRKSANLFNKASATIVPNKVLDESGNELPSDEYSYIKGIPVCPGKTYTISGIPLDDDHVLYVYFFKNNGKFSYRSDPIYTRSLLNGAIRVVASSDTYRIGFTYISSMFNINVIQVELGDVKTNYENYSIDTKRLPIPSDIYGCVYHVTDGKIDVNWAYIVYAGEDLSNTVWVSDIDKYVPGTNPTIGAHVAYRTSVTGSVIVDKITYFTAYGTNTIHTPEYYKVYISYVNSLWDAIPKLLELSTTSYEALEPEDQNNGTMYFLTDRGTIMLHGIEYGAAGSGGGSTFRPYLITESVQSSSTITTTITEE